VSKPEAELASALDRLLAAGLLFRQGVPPHASYLFKHALVQDAACGTLLREPRRALHAQGVKGRLTLGHDVSMELRVVRSQLALRPLNRRIKLH
jgi:hypothetical protein